MKDEPKKPPKKEKNRTERGRKPKKRKREREKKKINRFPQPPFFSPNTSSGTRSARVPERARTHARRAWNLWAPYSTSIVFLALTVFPCKHSHPGSCRGSHTRFFLVSLLRFIPFFIGPNGDDLKVCVFILIIIFFCFFSS